MNHIGNRFYQAAPGVYLFKNLLSTQKQNLLVNSTMRLWDTIYKHEKDDLEQPYNRSEPLYLTDSKQPFIGIRWITKDHEDLIFRGNHNLPFYVKVNLINELFFALSKQKHNHELQRVAKILYKKECDLNIGVNFFDTKSPQSREFSCGSLASNKTALMVYSLGPSPFFHILENKKLSPWQKAITPPLSIPHNTMVLFTKEAFQPNEKFMLPLFQEKIDAAALGDESDISKLTFSLRI